MLARVREDVRTVFERDPAARSTLEVLTCYPGLHAIWLHRVAHALWTGGYLLAARLLSHVTRFLTGIEIHPGAQIGRRFFIDHGHGVVIGETAVIGDDVSMFHGCTLGGTSSDPEKRHPTLEDGVTLGAHATLLGPITVGANARIGAGAVVVESVPSGTTAVGVPAHPARSDAGRADGDGPGGDGSDGDGPAGSGSDDGRSDGSGPNGSGTDDDR